MSKTWILLANSRHARLFERDSRSREFIELADFINPDDVTMRQMVAGERHGSAVKGHGPAAHIGTQFEPRTDIDEKACRSFARDVAARLNKGVVNHQCDWVSLIASSQMLGELRALLSDAAMEKLHGSVASDLTRYQGLELRQRISEALATV